MAELLKNIYDDAFFDLYLGALDKVCQNFDKRTFIQNVKDDQWPELALKQRMSRLANCTDQVLPVDLHDKWRALDTIVEFLRDSGIKDQNLAFIFLADIITSNGLDDIEAAIPAIERMTQFVSFEYAGRAFIIRYPERMMNQMQVWARHSNPNVRRFASEGCRPRLPWGLQLKSFVDDPSPIIPVLELLKNDPSEYVRKSVANNLNDISKDHPNLVTNIIRKWKGSSVRTDHICKHAARTMLKNGNKEVLAIFDVHSSINFSLVDFTIDPSEIHIGETVTFSFRLKNDTDKEYVFRIEYAIYFVKLSEKKSKKVFKIKEAMISGKDEIAIVKKHTFVDLTTRKHHPGLHTLAIIVNGNESQSGEILLM
ncbi:MAG: DNA alkylation repair protein [Saprospiraceae bacterium]